MQKNENIKIYQIFYDQASRQLLDPGFIPLDNTLNERPDWFEFWVIRNYLRNNELDENTWYGFFSPKFRNKTGLTADQVRQFVENHAAHFDVALFSAGWDQISYFSNPFEQGERWHPGLQALSQEFFDSIGMTIDLRNLVTDSTKSVFGNYLVAKPIFWREWLLIADRFFALVEARDSSLSSRLGSKTSYGSHLYWAPMKTFIQERFASALLATGDFRTAALDQSFFAPMYTRLFNDDFQTRRLLHCCDLMKHQYRVTGDKDYLSMFYKIRGQVSIRQPAVISAHPVKSTANSYFSVTLPKMWY